MQMHGQSPVQAESSCCMWLIKYEWYRAIFWSSSPRTCMNWSTKIALFLQPRHSLCILRAEESSTLALISCVLRGYVFTSRACVCMGFIYRSVSVVWKQNDEERESFFRCVLGGAVRTLHAALRVNSHSCQTHTNTLRRKKKRKAEGEK